MVPWPPWVQKGAGQEKDGRSPVLPKVQGEGVPSGPQDIAHTVWVQALGRGQGGVQGEALPGRAHLKPGGAVGLGLYPGVGQEGSCTQSWASGCGERTTPLPGHVGEGDPSPDMGQGGRAALPAPGDLLLQGPAPSSPARLQLTLGPCVRSLQRGLGAQGGGRRLLGQGGSGLSPPSMQTSRRTTSGMPPGSPGESQPGPSTQERCQRVTPGSETGAGPWPAGSRKEDGAAPAGATRGSPASRVSRTEEGEA